jgi:serine/threonine-protein kinase
MSPPNVLITKHGEVKIVDFGLAKATSQLEKSEAGIIKGKFSYLSPEAAQGIEVDHKTDIFAVGIILWEMLAGRRLFLGETDFATVKMVQQAQIPQLSQMNKAVPIELDRILARALAREPERRYASARDLGRDLTAFLYKFGKPVSAYDISEFVRGAMALRKKSQPDKASIIDKLIEEALLEFTSLQDDKGAPAASAKANEPLKLTGFEDIGKWADEIAVTNAPAEDYVRNSLPHGAFEEGNLAALEEDEIMPSSQSAPAIASPAPPAVADRPQAQKRPLSVAPSAQVAPFAAKTMDSDPPLQPSSGGTVKALLLVAVLGALAAGAYFGGLIPH